uniref:DUF834 domain-containing protein n=1 Tax=Oryza meridionalis TaxID=40149 RepID=A0A0E0EL17_9ORYZ
MAPTWNLVASGGGGPRWAGRRQWQSELEWPAVETEEERAREAAVGGETSSGGHGGGGKLGRPAV